MRGGVGEVVQGVLGINSRAVLVEVRVLAARRYHVAVRSRGDMLHAGVVTPDGSSTAEAIAEVVGTAVTRMLTFEFDYSRQQPAELFDVEE